MSQIEDIISELEDYIENCKYQPLSNNKIIVNKDELEEKLDSLKRATPEEIKRYQKIVSNKDAILADANKQADALIEQTKQRVQEMVADHEIMQQAYAQANEVVTIASNQAQEILDKATDDATAIRTSAMEYTDQLLSNLQAILNNAVEVNQENFMTLIGSLQDNLDRVNSNRAELHSQNGEPEASQAGGASSDGGIDVISSADESENE